MLIKKTDNLHDATVVPALPAENWWTKAVLTGAILSVASLSSGQSDGNKNVDNTTVVAAVENKRKPAYTLQIVSYGEGSPQAENLSEEGMQQNRRVDITLRGVPVDISTSAAPAQADTRGTIWLTEDPLSIERRLDITTAATLRLQQGALASPVRLKVFSNYSSYFSQWEVFFYPASDTGMANPVASVSGSKLGYESILEWNGVYDNGESIAAGDELIYVLRVHDRAGHVDETYPQTITVTGPERLLSDMEEPTLAELALEARQNNRRLARQQIPIRGSRVRIYGRELGDVKTVDINGESVSITTDGEFGAEYLLPDGEHQFEVAVTDSNGASYIKKLDVELNDQYMFLVGLADITVSRNTVSGGIDTLGPMDDSRFGGDIFVDGRLAFYLKGKVKGRYLLTAQLDTQSREIDQIFNGLSRTDPRSVFRRLDPEQYYPVYGDDSTLIDDTDSQGKMYVRVDWDQSRALWGNFNSGMTGTELAQFNRSLYGAQLRLRRNKQTSAGDAKTEFNVFSSQAQSISRHVEFKGTGGSLYYLRDKDIVTGSEKLHVEVRQRETDRVIDRIELREGEDYQIDDIQGRIILHKPLRTVGDQTAPSIIKDTPLDGNELWLVADYETVADSFSGKDSTSGARGKHWLNDQLAIGGTWVLENRPGANREVRGIDATLLGGPGTWLKAEYAQTSAAQTTGSFTSEDGGLNFQPYTSNDQIPDGGDAYSVEAQINIGRRLKSIADASLGAWVKRRDSGFSGGGYDSGTDLEDKGVEGNLQWTDRLSIHARVTQLEKGNSINRDTSSLQADYQFSERVSLAVELREIKESDAIAASTGSGTLAAIQAGIDITDNVTAYGALQTTIDETGSYETNDLVSIGVDAKIGQRLTLRADSRTGDAGRSLVGGAEYRVTDNYSIYLNQNISVDRTDIHRNSTTVGQRHRLNDKLRVYTEHQFSDEDQRAGMGHTFGLNFQPGKFTQANASWQVADFNDDTGGTTDRDAVTVGLAYKREKTHASTRFEYRTDKSSAASTEQWLTANSLSFSWNPSLRWQGKFNLSETKDRFGRENSARFIEAGLGFAYRPVDNDRLNMLGRISHLYDLPPLSQSESVDEKALIGSFEFAWQVNRQWEAGGKLAIKEARIRAERDSGDWVGNDATLLSLRLRYHLLFKWDALAQYHWLNSDAADDLQHGALVSVGKHVGDNVKLALGYNFTRFDDNLIDEEYDFKGWFVNLLGKY